MVGDSHIGVGTAVCFFFNNNGGVESVIAPNFWQVQGLINCLQISVKPVFLRFNNVTHSSETFLRISTQKLSFINKEKSYYFYQ